MVGLPPEHPTLPSLLRQAGYGTTLLGKWHLGNLPNFSPLKSVASPVPPPMATHLILPLPLSFNLQFRTRFTLYKYNYIRQAAKTRRFLLFSIEKSD